MINLGGHRDQMWPDGWTVVTADGSRGTMAGIWHTSRGWFLYWSTHACAGCAAYSMQMPVGPKQPTFATAVVLVVTGRRPAVIELMHAGHEGSLSPWASGWMSRWPTYYVGQRQY
eukprot:jgi/Ulvmu1/7380/UM036_0040.1